MGIKCGMEGELVSLSLLPSPTFANGLDPAVLRPPTDWQLRAGIPMTARKELAAILPPRAPSLRGQHTPHLLKTEFPDSLFSQAMADRQRREIKQGKEFQVG